MAARTVKELLWDIWLVGFLILAIALWSPWLLFAGFLLILTDGRDR